MQYKDNIDAINTIRFVNGTGCPIFLTGKAGTGKTTLLKNIVQNTHKNTIIVAPTGIAALNAGGVTIHSLFQLPFGAFSPAADLYDLKSENIEICTLNQLTKEIVKIGSEKRNLIRRMELLIIDEVSMLRADLLDAIDTVLRHIRRRKNDVFGGVQVLFIGDMLQLPPIVKDDEWDYLKRFYKSLFFFDALAFNTQKPILIELDKIYRQKDQVFIDILNNVRNNIFNSIDIATLNSYYRPDYNNFINKSYIFITTHNRKADKINQDELMKLETEEFQYVAEISGDFPENIYPVDYTLTIKKDAQIMFIKNDYSGGLKYFNGKIGKIYSLKNNSISVIFPDTGEIVEVDKYSWENKKFQVDQETGQIVENVIGVFTHYPIKLAWAVTVHKSQGLTFKKAIIDVSEAFAPGQIYVALSRLESLDGLILSLPITDNPPTQSDRLLRFTSQKNTHNQLEQEYAKEAQNYLAGVLKDTFDFYQVMHEFDQHLVTYDKDENRSVKQSYKSDFIEIRQKFFPLTDIANKFQKQLNYILNNGANNNQIRERVEAAIGYFEPILKDLSKDIFSLIDKIGNQRGVKAFERELRLNELLIFNKIREMDKCLLLIDSLENNEILCKSDIITQKHQERLIQLKEKPKSKSKKNKEKQTKVSTKEITYNMFMSGQSVEEIAKERKLTTNTIIGHLCSFVAKGVLSAEKLIDKAKLDAIKYVLDNNNTKSLNEIKNSLPEGYNFEEIKIAIAEKEFSNNY